MLIDKVQIQQVVVNLFRNAVDALEGAATRELNVSVRPSGSRLAVVAVSDTGPGVPVDVASRLFQPFVTTKKQGMGVGLSISRNIIEAHGGRIWAETRPGGGAVFRFSVPMASDEEAHGAG